MFEAPASVTAKEAYVKNHCPPFEEAARKSYSIEEGHMSQYQQFGSSQHEEVLRKLQESPGQMDADGRITRGPIQLRNGAIYQGQWYNN